MQDLHDRIQVCCYGGEWPNHEEYDCENVNTKQEAIEYIIRSRRRDKEKWNVRYNYRITDWLNRFPTMFFESDDFSYIYK